MAMHGVNNVLQKEHFNPGDPNWPAKERAKKCTVVPVNANNWYILLSSRLKNVIAFLEFNLGFGFMQNAFRLGKG